MARQTLNVYVETGATPGERETTGRLYPCRDGGKGSRDDERGMVMLSIDNDDNHGQHAAGERK